MEFRLCSLVLLAGVVRAVRWSVKVPRLEFSDQRPGNGLRVLIAPDHSAAGLLGYGHLQRHPN